MGTEKAVQGWVDCFPRCALAGTVFAGGVNGAGEIAGHAVLEQSLSDGQGRCGAMAIKQTAGREALGESAPQICRN